MANQDAELSNDSTQIDKTLASNMNNLTLNDSRAPTSHSWGWDLDETDAKSAKNNGYNETGDENYGWVEESQKVEEGNECTFPVRNGQPDCAFYLKTGSCKFGSNCRYNHPANVINNQVNYKSEQASFQIFYKENKWGGHSESNGQIDCKYYSTPGGCKYGRACRFYHKEKTDASTALNFLGLPVRLGEKECAYYMATGSCKYSANCRFHHPDPIAANEQNPLGIQNDRNTQSYSYPANRNGLPHGPYSLPANQQSGSQQSYASSVHQDGGVQQPYALPTNHNGGVQHPYVPPAQMAMAPWPAHRNVNEAVNYDNSSPFCTSGTGCYLPPQCVQPNGEWSGYQAPNNHMLPAEMNKPQPPASMINGVSRTAPVMGFDCVYPERPGQPECQFFMKTGDCKFKATCKYHHPKSRQLKKTEAILSPAGLPLRPDQPVCTHFKRHGCCKFGHTCRYHHPSDLNPSGASDAEYVSSFYTQEANYLFNYETVQESGW